MRECERGGQLERERERRSREERERNGKKCVYKKGMVSFFLTAVKVSLSERK